MYRFSIQLSNCWIPGLLLSLLALSSTCAALPTFLSESENGDLPFGMGDDSSSYMTKESEKQGAADDDEYSAHNSDSSVYDPNDPTIGSFFNFAEARKAYVQLENKNNFKASIETCPYAALSHSNKDENDTTKPSEKKQEIPQGKYIGMSSECVVGSISLDHYPVTNGRLFMVDAYTLGLVSIGDGTLRLFKFNMLHQTLTHIRTKHFHNEWPMDACADFKEKTIFIVFPNENKISKYGVIHSEVPPKQPKNAKFLRISTKNRTHIFFKELISIKETDFNPTTVSCNDNLVFVSERARKQIRVYDKMLRLVRIMNMNGVVISTHTALVVTKNLNVLIDGGSALGLFNVPDLNLDADLTSTTTSSSKALNWLRKKQRHKAGTNQRVCHFYSSMDCLEDVEVTTDAKSKVTNIYAADSCANEIKRFQLVRSHQPNGDSTETVVNERITQEESLRLPDNSSPMSVAANPFGYLFVFTYNPAKIYILKEKECNNLQAN